ncbi:MAG: hypothetical protein JSR62_07550 [Nitrospira sp.]|nr:hypothetical protein [Nitrospira sp.]
MAIRTACLVPVDSSLSQRCGKSARGRRVAKYTHDGQSLCHFECDAGHVFHSDETCRYYFSCDCRLRYAKPEPPHHWIEQ